MSQAPDITGTEGERLDATVTVDSTFSSQETQTIELRVEDGGTVVHTDTQDVTLADSTDSQQITLSWPTSGGDKGAYDLFLESDQDTIQRLVEVIDFDIATVADNHWRFDEGSGSVAADSAGSFDADFGTAISWGSDGDGKGGTYGILDGTGGADLGDGSASHWSHWLNSGVGGLGVWVKPTNLGTGRGEIFEGNISSVGPSWGLRLTGTASGISVEFLVSSSSADDDFIALYDTGTVTEDAWHSIAVRADGSTAEMFIDGTSIVTDSVSGTVSGTQDSIHIGQAAHEPNPYEGGIDDLWSVQSDPGGQAIKDWHNATKGNYS